MSRDFIDKVSRIALALERAGGDHEGSVESLHQDFLDIVSLVPEHLRDVPTRVRRVQPEAAIDLGIDPGALDPDAVS